jgi:hypothetical protein
MVKNINQLLKEKLKWKSDPNSKRNFITDSYPKEECYLRMNNFPDEPMWTLFYQGESIDFDDELKNWNITYRSDL